MLAILDVYVFNNLNKQEDIALERIGTYTLFNNFFHMTKFAVLQTMELSPLDNAGSDYIVAIDSSDYSSWMQPRMLLEIPASLVRMFLDMKSGVQLVSFLYADVTCLLPNSLPMENRQVLIYR